MYRPKLVIISKYQQLPTLLLYVPALSHTVCWMRELHGLNDQLFILCIISQMAMLIEGVNVLIIECNFKITSPDNNL